MACDHDALTRDPYRFRRQTTPGGVQDDGEGGLLVLGACPECQSTLAVDSLVLEFAVMLLDATTCMSMGDLDSASDFTGKAQALAVRIEARDAWRKRNERAA